MDFLFSKCLPHARATHGQQSFHIKQIAGAITINICLENMDIPSFYKRENLKFSFI